MGLPFFLILTVGLAVNAMINGFNISNVVALSFSALSLFICVPGIAKILGFGEKRGKNIIIKAGCLLAALLIVFLTVRLDTGNLVYMDRLKIYKASNLISHGKYEEGALLLKTVDEHGNLTTGARINLGTAYRYLKKYQDAMWNYQQALTENPANSICHINMGLLLMDMNDNNGALVNFQITAQEDPAAWICHMYSGIIYRNQGLMRKALDSYQKADLRMPEQPMLKYLMAKCAYDIADAEQARQYVEEALALEQPQQVIDELKVIKAGLERVKGGD